MRRNQQNKRILSVLLVIAMICSVIPYWPEGMFGIKANAAVSWVDGATVSKAEKGTGYYFDLSGDGKQSQYTTPGTYGLMTVATGPKNAIGYQNQYYGIQAKEGNNFTIQVPGNCYIVVTGDNNSAPTITATSETGSFDLDTRSTSTKGHCDLETAKVKGDNSVPFLYAGTAGNVTLTLNGSTAYINAICVIPASDDVELKQYEQKTFHMDINGAQVSVTTGADAASDSTATVSHGALELATVDSAIITADLSGKGNGILTQEQLSNISDNITATVTEGNKIEVQYKDTTKNPASYTIYVRDNSAEGKPVQDGTPVTYNLNDGSVLSPLYAGKYQLTDEKKIQSSDKLFTLVGNKGIFIKDPHGIAVSATDEIKVKVAGNAKVDFANCAYSSGQITATVTTDLADGDGTITPSTVSAKAATDGDITQFDYKGDAAVLTFTFDATAYVHSVSVTNEAKASAEKKQKEMPSLKTFGTADNMTVTPVGQRIVMAQNGGSLKTDNGKVDSSVSYYGFDETTEAKKLSADVVLNTCGSNNLYGVFFGAFSSDNIATVGIRNNTGLRGIYSKSSMDMAGAGGINTAIQSRQQVSFTAEKTDEGFTVTATPKGEETQTMTFKYKSGSYLLFSKDGKESPVSYGFIISSASATITNMKYYAENGELLYDQNDCYEPVGTAPVISTVTAKAADTRDSITVNWTNSTEADGDGKYVLQARKDEGVWEDIATDLTEKTFTYPITDAGDYRFRVCGKLGKDGARNAYTESSVITVIAALPKPVVNIDSTEHSITLKWNAVSKADKYEIYRYSYDETEKNAKLLKTISDLKYLDTSVVSEMPYYYYIVARSSDNYSNPSDVCWTVPSSGHTGDYVYENESAQITITKKSYDTVYDGKITLEGISEKAGDVRLEVNGKTAATAQVKQRGSFAFDDIAISQGRNDVNLYVTDQTGKVTRETYNFVYLTDYNYVVDQNFRGEDGTKNADGIVTYKKVQTAVDSIPSGNNKQVIILVKEGDYEENLQVKSPYITLIGEDSTKTRIHYNSKNAENKDHPELGQIGGDMALRCAVCIQKSATSFSAENLTFENTYEYKGTSGSGNGGNESCDALRNDAENTSYVNVRIVGYQDTLCTNQGKQYYYKCFITGNVDFIYGNEPRALFNDCKLVFRYAPAKNSGYVCAPRTAASGNYGLTFNNCQILSDGGCSGSAYYLARPWGADAYATWINCYMGKVLKYSAANPYNDMSGNLAEDARFFEYGNYGPAFTINTNRRQISSKKASDMLKADYLGWDPYSSVQGIGEKYIGSAKTTAKDRYVTTTYENDTYNNEEGDDTGLSQYRMEGYAQSSGVTGGGNLYETSDNYYKVASAKEFLTALTDVKNKGGASVIELTSDIALGSKEITDFDKYSSVIKEHTYQALTHPDLKKTGVSMLMLSNYNNLTIYSKNGAKITHACTDITNSTNIVIRNIKFDELWEWDDASGTSGAYDRNDWDYLTIEKGSADIWVDHCTFYKSYDGIIDVKTPVSPSNITISWCEFLPASDGNTFFNAMMDELKNNRSDYGYYSHLLDDGMTEDQVYGYAFGQKKTHLFGQSDTDASATNLYVTLANNYYKDSMDRMPRIRFGTSHVYNCVMDAQKLRDIRASIKNNEVAQKIVSNGASSTCGAHMLLQNCNIIGITNALNSGNGDSPAGYLNAVNTLYTLDGKTQNLAVGNNNTLQDGALIQKEDEFTDRLPAGYEYTLKDADKLSSDVVPYTGAGKLDMTTLQWEKNTYTAKEHDWDDGVITLMPTCEKEGIRTYTCKICGEKRTEAIPKLSISEDVKQDHNGPKTELSDSFESLFNNILTEEEKNLVLKGASLKFTFTTEEVTDKLTENQKQLIENVLNGNSIGTYLDLLIKKQIGSLTDTEVTSTNAPIKVKITVPEYLKNKNNSKKRTYKVIRLHGTEVTVLDGVYHEDDGTFEFASDKFSVFALVYSDADVSDHGGNGDNGKPDNGNDNGDIDNNGNHHTGSEMNPSNNTESNNSDIDNDENGQNVSTDADDGKYHNEGVIQNNTPDTGDRSLNAWLMVAFILSTTVMVMVRKKRKAFR